MTTGKKEYENERLNEIRRSSYLTSKGITPKDPHQLSIVFGTSVGAGQDFRNLPNDVARSAIYTTKNKVVPRKQMKDEVVFHCDKEVAITFTGEELRANDDLLIWLQIVKYGERVALGTFFEFGLGQLVHDVGWPKNGHYYANARKSLERLKTGNVKINNSRSYGVGGIFSFIKELKYLNDEAGQADIYSVQLSDTLVLLFAGQEYTAHEWSVYRGLTPIARRLADYAKSHKAPFPIPEEKFQKMCGSDGSSRVWRKNLRKACLELVTKGILAEGFVTSKGMVVLRRP